MLHYLSAEWLEAAAAALQRVVLDPPATEPFELETVVTRHGTGSPRNVAHLRDHERFTLIEQDTIQGIDLEGAVGAAAETIDGTTTDHDVNYLFRFRGGNVALIPHAAADASLPRARISQSITVAEDIAAGRRSAHEAFANGDVRLGGDIALLSRHAALLSAIDDALAEVRSRTVFSS